MVASASASTEADPAARAASRARLAQSRASSSRCAAISAIA